LIKMKKVVIFNLIVIFMLIQSVSCRNADLPDNIIKKDLTEATKLLISRDKVAKKSNRIVNIKAGIASLSTQNVDNFVKKRIKFWLSTTNKLEKFSQNYPLHRFSDDALFVATILWVAISQADAKYSEKTIDICKDVLSLELNLSDNTVKMLKRIPSLQYLIKNEFYTFSEEDVKVFLRRMLVSEYIKTANFVAAETWLENSEIPIEEKQRLADYIKKSEVLYNMVQK